MMSMTKIVFKTSCLQSGPFISGTYIVFQILKIICQDLKVLKIFQSKFHYSRIYDIM